MKKILIALLASSAVLFSACTVDNTVASGDVEYREIRIDGFSHYWKTQQLLATHAAGGSLVFEKFSADTLYGVDSLFLADTAYDKTATLPEHAVTDVPNFYGSNFRLIYKTSVAPRTFSCYFYNHGKTVNVFETERPSAFLYRGEYYLEGDELFANNRAWFTLDEDLERMEPIPCGYLPGKGFYLGSRSYDDFSTGPFWLAGEFVIRY